MRFMLASMLMLFATAASAAEVTLLNASYDPTRELYADYNRYFAKTWKAKTGDTLRVRMSHAGSGAQARAINEGLPADVATLALGFDIDAVAARGGTATDWQERLPQHSSPYRSVIVFLVRKGNPHHIRDWADLTQPGIRIITPNPKTSGGARWNYLAAWAYAQTQPNPESFMRALLKNVLLFDIAARASTTNFVRRHQGDVLITWENEAYVAQHYFEKDGFEIVIPSVTILAEPTVAVIDRVASARGTTDIANAYLRGLYSREGQTIIAQHFFRPTDPSIATSLPKLDGVHLATIRDFGGWQKAQQTHFADGGSFDRLSAPEDE